MLEVVIDEGHTVHNPRFVLAMGVRLRTTIAA